MNEFFAMGGYGAYVWSAYGLTAAVITGLIVRTVLHCGYHARRVRRLEREEERAP